METNTARKEEGTDRAFRDAMVDKLRDWGGVRTAPVEAAMRAVPRHVFVPEASLEQAYGHDSVITHRDENGRAISSASGPGVVAAMLEQLDVQPGDRVLEIGAGTGYNAALVAELSGPGGHVTAVDIGADIVAGARRGLTAAGFDRVKVVHGDGAAGHPEDAPYDRIIVRHEAPCNRVEVKDLHRSVVAATEMKPRAA
ncbi:methyltransferase domain-containing protein, partial [Nonomuraea purpurea]